MKIRKMIPDVLFLKLQYWKHFHKKLNINNPMLFNEKLAWIKLYDRRPEYREMVDKYVVKSYIAKKIGKEYVVPVIGGPWENVNDINFDKLPKQFVLKCTHNSHGLVICKDKEDVKLKEIKQKMKVALEKDSFYFSREWPYKKLKPMIIAEKYIEPSDGCSDLTDFKIFCFNGTPMYCQVIKNRTTMETIDFFDMNWKHQKFIGLVVEGENYKNAEERPQEPVNFEKMKKFSKLLAENIPFCRVDFYESREQLYFGEITFFPCAGLGNFEPKEWNYKMGSLLKLDLNKR